MRSHNSKKFSTHTRMHYAMHTVKAIFPEEEKK
jgi:hypothetical protein